MAGVFKQLVVIPEEEDGRTVYFDWVEHEVEAPNGRTYRLQVVSVPGQARWGARRAHLVALAHVVLFVADTRRRSWPDTVERWRSLLAARAEGQKPAAPIVFQANKRDCADLVPLEEIRDLVPSAVPIIESSAALEVGVEEAFWEAVRLASSEALPPDTQMASDGLDEPQALLDRLIQLDSTTDQLSSQAATVRDGFVWPPVEGRSLLRQSLGTRSELRVVEVGTYGLGQAWRIFSPREALFQNVEDGREALIEWARVHGRLAKSLSGRRCIVVLETTDGKFRLWQLAHRERTLRELLTDHEPFGGMTTPSERLVLAALLVRRVHARAEELAFDLTCTLDTVGWTEHGPHYVGLMPYPLREPGPLAMEELTWQLETFLVSDAEGSLRTELDARIERHTDPTEREFLQAAFGSRA